MAAILISVPVDAAIIFEPYADRAAFEARLGGVVRVLDFDDVETAVIDPAPFESYRYLFSDGILIEGEAGQFASRSFGLPGDFPPSSLPNSYAPGPISFTFGQGGNYTDVEFLAGLQFGAVAGVGVVFIDADFPGDGPSSLSVYDALDRQLATTGPVSGPNASRLFRGFVAVDTGTNQPVNAIVSAFIQTGQGWPGNDANEGVTLDDLVFGTPAATGDVSGEICNNCVDDDGDDFIDRSDPECAPPAFGAAAGLGDPRGAGKAAVKCQHAIAVAGRNFVVKRVGHLLKCFGAVAKCTQLKNGDTGCIEKAAAICGKERGAATTKDVAKLRLAIAKGCGGDPPRLAPVQLLGDSGLGFGAEASICDDHGVPALTSAADVAECLLAQHACLAERIAGQTVPRAREYLTLAGGNPSLDLPCLPVGADGGGQTLDGVPKRKALAKCDTALRKAAVKVLQGLYKVGAQCVEPGGKCIQQKPGDRACLAKARTKCLAAATKLRGPRGTETKLLAAVLKRCGNAPLELGDLLVPRGLGFGSAAARCSQFDIPPLTAPTAVAQCAATQELCEASQILILDVPRGRELVELYGLFIQEDFFSEF